MTFDEHVERLAKYCVDSDDKELIRQNILDNEYIMDETSLLSYYIYKDPLGKHLFVMFASGDGETIYKWLQEEAKRNGCVTIECLTTRAKAIQRKWGFKPIATHMRLEVK